MERISIFNYEAFYLDFLEGNLNEADAVLLMNFLEENPSLRMEDEELPLFDVDTIVLDEEVKNELRQPLLTDKIHLNNVEFFLISEAEGLLPEPKIDELTLFISNNQSLMYDKGIYAVVKFAPDMSVVYANKAGLKRKKTITLWPYISIASAAAVILFFMTWSSINNTVIDFNNPRLIKANTKNQNETSTIQNSERMNDIVIPNNDLNDVVDNGYPTYVVQHVGLPSIENQGIRVVEAGVDQINHRSVKPVLTSIQTGELEPITKRIYAENNQEKSKNNVPENGNKALARFVDMQNPIEPVTSFIESRTNREVDFRTTKKIEGKRKGFFLKVGKLEISRKKH
ncbi:MAG: hypothetical protein MK105_04335 [Crocinitomicaceae bacterium]|nr:hypothetical protein [Crocinitomicaceae bacterium]